MQAAVLQHRPRVVAEREKNVVVELLEAVRPVGADHHAMEVVADVDRHGHQRVDLLVRGGVAAARLVLAHDLVALHHPVGKALRHPAVGGIVLEPAGAHQVELAVAVVVLAGEQQAHSRRP